MTTDGVIPDDQTLQSMRHGSPALPPHVGGLTPEQCGVLAALRDGARMWRKWPKCEHGPGADGSQQFARHQRAHFYICRVFGQASFIFGSLVFI